MHSIKRATTAHEKAFFTGIPKTGFCRAFLQSVFAKTAFEFGPIPLIHCQLVKLIKLDLKLPISNSE